MSEPRFQIGDHVFIRFDRSRTGHIKNLRSYGAKFDYLVFLGDEEAWFAETALEPVPRNSLKWRKRDEFLRDLFLAKMRFPLSDNLYAFRASRTLFEPYQFRPALKFLKNPDQRLLIADEVGLGKTIEAAIIYLELKARMDISRVLVVCPSRLKTKWRDELRNRFDEEFVELDSENVRRIFEDHLRLGNAISFRAIVSYETLRRPEFIDILLGRELPIDLLIMDEAHYMRNASTATHQVGAALTNTADAVLFLTATPLHLGNPDLYHLLNLLAPGDFDDPKLFVEQIRPNAHINRASQFVKRREWTKAKSELRQVEHTVLRNRFIGNPYYEDVLRKLDSEPVDLETQVSLQRELLDLNTLSAVFTRTRKREVADSAVRAAYTIRVEFTPQERLFYDGILRQVREELRRTNQGAVGFAIVTKERMAASCLIALRESFEHAYRTRSRAYARMDRTNYDLDELDSSDDPVLTNHAELLELSRRIGKADSKYDKFEETVQKFLAENPDSKILVFSTYIGTLEYLCRRLRERGYQTDVIHGKVSIPDRQSIIDRFREDPSFRILLSSEVGAEGLDFQFCNILVNYDLPWNPMQVEQRIGRLDRFGQKWPRIHIINLCIADTIEDRIFQRLYDRIQIFQESVGDLEAILGEEIRKLSRRVLQAELTPEEEIQMAEEAARRIIRSKQEAEELEQQKDELLGQDIIFNEQVISTIESGRVIHADEVRALVQTFLHSRFPNVEFTRDKEEATWTITITEELAVYLRPYMNNRQKNYLMGPRFQEAIGHHRQVALTFDSELARQRKLLEFVTWHHVLAGAAIDYWQEQLRLERGTPAYHACLYGPPDELGTGYFFIFALDERGVNSRRTLAPVIVLEDGRLATETAKTLLEQLSNNTARPTDLEFDEDVFEKAQEIASTWIAIRRDEAEEEATNRNDALVQVRSASIRASFDAKIRRAEELYARAYDARIKRLYEGQIRNLRAKRAAKLKELEDRSRVSVSHMLVAAGCATISLDTSFVQPSLARDGEQHDPSTADRAMVNESTLVYASDTIQPLPNDFTLHEDATSARASQSDELANHNDVPNRDEQTDENGTRGIRFKTLLGNLLPRRRK